MKILWKIISGIFLTILLQTGTELYGQEDYWDSLLVEQVKVENPVYKPVVGIGYGGFSFLGDVRNPDWNLFNGNPGARLTVSTFINKAHSLQLDFNLMTGSLSANQGTLGNHLNFYTDLTAFGIDIFYGFAHINHRDARIIPFTTIGIETFRFNAKADLRDAAGNPYNYSEDGTIRNDAGSIIQQDFVYETDLRNLDLYGLGNYAQMGFAIPIEIGVEAYLGRRVMIRAGTSLHITSSDLIDNVNKSSGIPGVNRMPDMFTFSGISIHLDLFSDPEYIKVDKLFSEYETDTTLMADEDNDWVLDFGDQCPASPPGVVVDSLGCPIDSDSDGIPDYLDKELNTLSGHLVNDEGVLLPDSTFARMLDSLKAINRSDLSYYLNNISVPVYEDSGSTVPLKFKEFDQNEDNYISFAELLDGIDKYFDYRTFLSLQDIYEFIEFYFSQ